MFLKSLEINGFKSFADKTRLEFSDGITSLLGPNGSGKSNIVDAIKWVLGTQSLSSLRAGKREDVIFSGTDNRKPLQMCEVTLTIDNENGCLGVDEAEVEIKRRLFRTGESEFYINREKVLLKNVRELFLDTGVGKAAYSILEQGKIDSILSTKPEDRRYVFEEAAGISRFKVQVSEAERKLTKTDENLVLVNAQYQEVKKTYDSRKIQVEKLRKKRELTEKKEQAEVDLQLYSVQSFRKLYEFKKEQLKEKEKKQALLTESLKGFTSQLDEKIAELDNKKDLKQQYLADLHGYREKISGIDNEMILLKRRFEETKERRNHAEETAQRYQERVEQQKESLLNKMASLEENYSVYDEVSALMKEKQVEIEKLQEEKIKNTLDSDNLNGQITKLDESQHSIVQEISTIASAIVDELDENINSSGYSAMARRDAEKHFFQYINKVKEKFFSSPESLTLQEITESLDEIKGLFQEYSGSIPTFLDDFISPEGTITQKRNLDKMLSEARETIQNYRNEIENKAEDNKTLVSMIEETKEVINEMNIKKREAEFKITSLKESIAEMQSSLDQREFEFSDASKAVENEQAGLEEVVSTISETESRKKETIQLLDDTKASMSEILCEIEQLESEISSSHLKFAEQEQEKQNLQLENAKLTESISGIEEQIKKVFSDFFDTYQKSLKEFDDHEVVTSVDELREQLSEIRKKMENLGYINYMAEEEFEEAKTSYDFIGKNLDDLKSAREDLQTVILQIKTQSEQLFMDTYQKISKNFESMFSTLFSGGMASLNLVDPENPLISGIEIMAQPPGKKLNPLSLLSGGERSMTAVALLFATYMVKPAPFCILDEIDAALDDRSIGAFLAVLTNFAKSSQFIIITHNKHTVMGSKTLLGVTQQEPGVSITIGYKIDSIEELPVIFDEEN